MKLDLTKPVQTRDGRKARILCTDAHIGMPVIALVAEPSASERVVLYGADGNFFADKTEESRNDLVNVPETRKLAGRVNVYEWGITSVRESKYDETRPVRYEGCLACIDLSKLNITYTVGEGL